MCHRTACVGVVRAVVAAFKRHTSDLHDFPIDAMTGKSNTSRGLVSRRSDDSNSAVPLRATASVNATTRGFWRGFGTALLEALHESRSRQAAREIQNHQHLIEEARLYKLKRPEIRSQSDGMVVKVTIVALLVIFGALHFLGGATLERSVRPPAETGTVMLSGN
jgi:hypothetical protein